MAFESKKSTIEAKGDRIPKYSETCSVLGCDNETAIHVLLLRDEAGRQKAADMPSKYINTADGNWYLKKGWFFDTWVTRCLTCYERDLARRNHV